MYTADGRKVQVKIYPDGRVERVRFLTKDLTGNEKKGQKDASAKQKSISEPANNKLFEKDAPTFKLNKNPIPKSEPYRINNQNPKNEPNSKNQPNTKDKTDPKINYLKIPIVKNPDIMGKILNNPPKKLKDIENVTNKKGTMYYIKNQITNKRYIGQTTVSIDERLKGHFKTAKSNSDTRYS